MHFYMLIDVLTRLRAVRWMIRLIPSRDKILPEIEAEHTLPCTANVKIEWSHTHVFTFSLMGFTGSTLFV
jgi:hypothetical protein